MNTLKNYIIGLSTMFILALSISGVALAHSDDTTSFSSMRGNSIMNDTGMMSGMGMMMNNPMWNADMNDEGWTDMQRMHEIMWKDGELSKEEFEWLANKQDEFMGPNRMNNFEDVSKFNAWKKSDEGGNRSMMESYFNSGGRSMQR